MGSQRVLPGKGVIFMKGLVFDTENQMQFKDFGEPLLDNLQKEVGGCIEVVHPKYLPEGLCMVIDDEGLLKEIEIDKEKDIENRERVRDNGSPTVDAGLAEIIRSFVEKIEVKKPEKIPGTRIKKQTLVIWWNFIGVVDISQQEQ